MHVSERGDETDQRKTRTAPAPWQSTPCFQYCSLPPGTRAQTSKEHSHPHRQVLHTGYVFSLPPFETYIHYASLYLPFINPRTHFTPCSKQHTKLCLLNHSKAHDSAQFVFPLPSSHSTAPPRSTRSVGGKISALFYAH